MSPAPSKVVVTTTLFRGEPTASVTAVSNSGPDIPVGAIVGGILGGAFLAVAVVFTWVLWGKSIKRQKRKQDKEMRNLRITDKNTRRNASALARPRPSSYLPPVFWPPARTKVKFVDGGSAAPPPPPDAEPKEKQTRPRSPPVPVRRPRPAALSSDRNPSANIIFPWRKTSADKLAAAAAAGRASPHGSDETDYYSVASGDDVEVDAVGREEQHDAAPGDATQRLSHTSSTWSFLLRNGFRRAPSNNAMNRTADRASQATSASAYSQPSQPNEPMPVGVAV